MKLQYISQWCISQVLMLGGSTTRVADKHFGPRWKLSLLLIGLSFGQAQNVMAGYDCSGLTTFFVNDSNIHGGDYRQYQGHAYQCISGHGSECRSSTNNYIPGSGTAGANGAWTDKGACNASSSSVVSSSVVSSSVVSSSRSSSVVSSSVVSSSVVSSSRSSSLTPSSSSSSVSSSLSSAGSSGSSYAPAQSPLFLSATAKPHVALVMSMDQELSKKAYSDYSNLDGGNLRTLDTTYRDDFTYYGYFDSSWCYTYTTGATSFDSYFTPVSQTTTGGHFCGASGAAADVATAAGRWSGNFLNWATMTRMDIVRRVLFGGKRAVDTTSRTVLERAFLPRDAHAYVKLYAGTDINRFTPYTGTQSFCNVSSSEDVTTGYPMMRIAAGSYPMWASAEGMQCQTGGATSPAATVDATVKVEACVTAKDGGASGSATSGHCRKYGTATLKKPSGLLQNYEDGSMKFSLTTGSYKSHLKGGVVRKGASLIGSNATASNDEVNLTNGTFNTSVDGIIQNINSFRVASYNNNNYSDCNTYSIPIGVVKANSGDTLYDVNKRCTDWGNPLAETYLEMLRFISGLTTPTSGFDVDDSSAADKFPGVAGLTHVSTWTDPWTEWCASCSAIVLSTGANSFDSDDLGSASGVAGLSAGASAVTAKTDSVGTLQAQYDAGSTSAVFAGNYFNGGTGTGARNCVSTSLTNLSDARGICPESPALEGSYNIAGLAYHAHITDLRSGLTGTQVLNTYAVDLAESLPSFTAVVNGKKVSFAPACESNDTGSDETRWQGCTLIDVIVSNLHYDAGGSLDSGTYLITWEDSLWGFDHDLDAAQQLSFCVGPTACADTGVGTDEIRISNTIPYAHAGNRLRFSYSIYGVDNIRGSFYNNPASIITSTAFVPGIVTFSNRPGGNDYDSLATNYAYSDTATDTGRVGKSVLTFRSSSTNTVKSLRKPLWYAAKFGGFIDKAGGVANQPDTLAEWDTDNDGVPDNFFSVKNPALLESSLQKIFDNIVQRAGSASAVATSSSRLAGDSFVYQGVFESKVWNGELRAYQPDSTGAIPVTPTYKTTDTGRMPQNATGRVVKTYVDGSTVNFAWANLNATQKALLALPGDVAGTDQKRADWILGNSTNEGATGLRVRTGTTSRNILGDIVNSGPAFLGKADARYDNLSPGGDSYRTFYQQKILKDQLVFVGANDGMLHAFIGNSATTSDILKEKFAYIPNLVFGKLAKLTMPDYGTPDNPHQYTVDGSIAINDVYTNGAWKTIVVGALGAGGEGIYALDVTNRASPTVLFEYTHADLGFVMGKPYIAPTAEGRWVIVVGNGPGSGTTSKLFLIDIADPAGHTQILNTGAGVGLSSPSIVLDPLGRLRTIFAGDLSGNMWRFLVSDPTPSNWTSYRLFTTNTGQPITAAPSVGFNDILNTYMVYFGTGEYFDEGDNLMGSVRQSFYAIPDLGSGTTVTRSDLLAKTMTTNYTATPPTRTISTTNPNWSTQKGWYIDLDFDTTAGRGERVTTRALLLQDKLLITTLIPSNVVCVPGGQSWLMEVPAVGDKFIGEHVIPANSYNDGIFPGEMSIGILPPKPANSSASSGASSSVSAVGSCPSSTDVSLINSGTKTADDTTVPLSVTNGKIAACGYGRQSWRQTR